MDKFEMFLYGIYPYICLTVFFLGSLLRFDREQYSWKSESSQLIHQGNLRLASSLFHVGIIGLFFGHFIGLLTPLFIWEALGVTHTFKQIFAMTLGGILGLMILVGLLMLMHRRFSSARLRNNSTWRDKLVLLWLLVTLLLGLSTIPESAQHLDGTEMVLLMEWAQHIITFRPEAAIFALQVSTVFKLHLFMGMTLFLIFPFTRLVHVWSGFASVFYLCRPWQLVRTKQVNHRP